MAGVAPKHRSLWLEEALAGEHHLPPLDGPARADVCVVGGGFVGLWTAYWLKQWDPACSVAVLEQDVCGGGASGRNGGFVLGWWPKFPSLERSFGGSDAAEMCRRSTEAIGAIEMFAKAHGIEIDFVRGGWLWTARTESQLDAWEDTVRATERHAPGTFVRLSPDEVADRTGSRSHLAGVLERSAATIQPAR